jgi:uncharacterized protein (TIGR02421 family)
MSTTPGGIVEPHALPPDAERVDRDLARLSSKLDWIRAVSPTNLNEQWRAFRKHNYCRSPRFRYRDKPDVAIQRAELKNLPTDSIEHPLLKTLLVEKQLELSRLLELIELRGTSGFLQQSIALFGEAEPALVAKAKEILEVQNGRETITVCIGADEFVKAAVVELDYYRSHCEDFDATVKISEHIAAGVMVVDGQLVVAANLRTSKHRLDALLHHEIGTHIVTCFNGSRQPLRQLKSGLAHYDATQEGLGVLAEYLCGNLSLSRLRTLAARVVAVRALTEGADFVEMYQTLTHKFGLLPYSAFLTSARVLRGGGLTKDVVYLRGLQEILDYLKEGHSVEDLFIGKFSLAQLTALVELRQQGWLVQARLLPRYWTETSAHERLQLCAENGLPQLLNEATT